MCSPSGEVRGAKDRGEAGGSRRKVKGFSQNKTKAHKGGRQCTNSNARTHTHTSVTLQPSSAKKTWPPNSI